MKGKIKHEKKKIKKIKQIQKLHKTKEGRKYHGIRITRVKMVGGEAPCTEPDKQHVSLSR
jgi:hypothetical protein